MFLFCMAIPVFNMFLNLINPLETDGGWGNNESCPRLDFIRLHPTVGADILTPVQFVVFSIFLYFSIQIPKIFGTFAIKTSSQKNKNFGSSEEDEVSGFFVVSHLWMRGYFRLG